MRKHRAEVFNTACGKRFNRSAGNGVGAHAFGADVSGDISGRSLKRRLAQPHSVVVGDDFFSAEVGEREKGRFVSFHLRKKLLSECGVGIYGDIHGREKALARDALKETSADGFAGRPADGVHKTVEAVGPAVGKFQRSQINGFVGRDVKFNDLTGPELVGKALDSVFKAFVIVGKRELSSFASAGLRDTVGNRAV